MLMSLFAGLPPCVGYFRKFLVKGYVRSLLGFLAHLCWGGGGGVV